MLFIYIIGAECTGKTTLSKALTDFIRRTRPAERCELLNETARTVLANHGFSREDVTNGGERCLELQRLIMKCQIKRELDAEKDEFEIVVSDRSALDPLVYAQLYCGNELSRTLESEECWMEAERRLRSGFIIVCEPVQNWLTDDGIRLLPQEWKAWKNTHERFCQVLRERDIAFTVLPSTIVDLSERVELVIAQLQKNI